MGFGLNHLISGGDGAGGTWTFKNGVLTLAFSRWHGTSTCTPVDENTFLENGEHVMVRVKP